MLTEKEVVVGREVLGDEVFVLGQEFSKRGEGVGADFEAAFVDPLEEVPEDSFAGLLLADVNGVQLHGCLAGLAFVVEDNGGDGVVRQRLP